MRDCLAIALLLLGVGCDASDAGPIDAGLTDAGRIDAAAGTIGPDHGTYSLEWICDTGCLGGAPFQYYDELIINRDAAPIELTYRQLECGPACDVVDTATLSSPCIAATGIDLGDGTTTDPYSFCPDNGGPTAEINYRGFPGPNQENKWFGHAEPLN